MDLWSRTNCCRDFELTLTFKIVIFLHFDEASDIMCNTHTIHALTRIRKF